MLGLLKDTFYEQVSGSRLVRRGFSILLCLLIMLSVLPVTSFAAGEQYPLPQKITAIDASDSSADNSAWYNGTELQGGVTTVIARYLGYVAGQANPVSALASVLGTESCPYIIETGLELAAMSGIVNGGTDDFSGKYIKLAGSKKQNSSLTNNAIDLIGACGILYQSSASDVSWLSCDYNNNSFGWTPIGTAAESFDGTIYADANVNIYNLSANLTGSGNHLTFGLFGYIGSNAVLENLRLIDVQIKSSADVVDRNIGTLVGSIATGAEISGCEVTGITSGRREHTADGTDVVSSLDSGTSYSGNWYTVPDFSIAAAGTQSACIGGVAACTDLGADKATSITNCSVNIKIEVDVGKNIGGVIGSVEKISKGTFTISGVSGTVFIGTSSATDCNMHHVGGVMGYCNVNTAANRSFVNIIINNVGTQADVFDVTFSGRAYVDSGNNATFGGFGGIIGYCNTVNSLAIGATAASEGTAAPCYVKLTAELAKSLGSSDNNNFYAGGIIGRIKPEYNASAFVLNVESCNVSDSVFRRPAGTTDTLRISMGGIIGGVNKAIPNSTVNNCVVDNFDISTDGFCGGIVGIGYSASGCNIANLTNCTVMNSEISQASASDERSSYLIVGGIAASIDTNTNTVINCKVIDSSLSFLVTSKQLSHNQIGGIAGKIVGTSSSDLTTVSNCISRVSYIIGASDMANGGVNPTGVFFGGISGYASNVVIDKCISVIDYSTYTTFTNNIESTPVQLSLSSVAENSVCGGFVGYTRGNVTITDSYTTGCIDVKYPTAMERGDRSNVIGGLVGVTGGSGFIMSNCFSTASLAGDLKDAVGGLIGYNSCTDAAVSNCHFGGSLMNASNASIVNYSDGGSFTNITYNQKMSPNAPCATDAVTATHSQQLPAVISNATSAVNADCFTLATTVSVSFTGDNVFAVNDSFTGTSRVLTNTATAGGITVERPVKQIKNLIDSTQNGCDTPFLIESATDLTNMQAYVAAGGGFLGARFTVNADITSALSVPIGMANNTVEYADENNQPFCGVFDGGGHTITLTEANHASQNYNGFFGYIQNAAVRNANLVYQNATTIETANYAGGLVGYAAFSDIDNISVKAVNGLTLGGTVSGGIVGYAKSTVVNGDTTSHSSFTGKLSASGYLGGIVGKTSATKPSFCLTNGGSTSFVPLKSEIVLTYTAMQEPSVSNAFVIGDVLGGTGTVGVNSGSNAVSVGGIIGDSLVVNTQVDTCFVKGNVCGGKYVGGIIGSASGVGNTPLIVDSYMHGDVYGNDFCGGITGYVKASSTQKQLVNSVYFVGQIECAGSMGALTSSSANDKYFFYDMQVAGNLPICANVQDNENAEAASAQLIANSFETGETITHPPYSAEVRADEITLPIASGTENTVTSGTHTSKITFNGSWSYTGPTGTISSMTDYNEGVRFAVKNTTGTNNSVIIKFTGENFYLYDHITGGHDGYDLTIDGHSVTKSTGATVVSTVTPKLSRLSQPYTEDSQNATIEFVHYSGTGNNSAPLIFIRALTGTGELTANNIIQSLSIENLENKEHTIVISAHKTEDNSYMNIRGYAYSGGETVTVVAADKLGAGFTVTAANYPQLTEFMTDFAAVSDLSTDLIYDFTADGTSNAHNFSAGDSVTVNSASFTCDKSSSALSALGVTEDPSGTYSVTTGGNSGFFTLTNTALINGYSLSVNEKLVVVPFALGEGTEESPYLIRNVKELIQLRDYVNETYSGAGQHFRLAMGTITPAHSADGDVYDLSGVDQADDGDKTTVAVWNTPIGTEGSPFKGVFDGNSKTVSNLNITSLMAEADEGTCYNGLFGFVSSGEIKNLTVEFSADFAVNNSLAALTNKNTYFGAVASSINSSVVKNCSVLGTAEVLEKNIDASHYVLVGGALGCVGNASSVYGVLSEADVCVSSVTAATSDKHAFGGVIGGIALTETAAAASVRDCIAACNIDYAYDDETKTPRLSQGGIIGQIYSDSTNGTVTVANNSAYGTYNNYRGNLGGIIGYASVSSKYSLALTGNVSSASLTIGAQSAADSVFNLGGLIGRVVTAEASMTMTSNSFFGELNAVDNPVSNRSISVGGLAGVTNNLLTTASTDNYYDSTKNRGLTNAGGASKNSLFSANTEQNGKKTSAAFSSGGSFPSVTLSESTSFGSAANTALAEKIVNGNSAPLYIVRNDNVYLAGESSESMTLSSVFTPSGASTSLFVTAYDASSAFYKRTDGSKRVVSVGSTFENAVTVRIVSLDGEGNDTFGGKGKTVTYYPDTSSVGLTDVSYLSANGNGDKVYDGTAAKTYSIYTADSFMGLDCALESSREDGYGNPCQSVLPAGYSIYLGANIDASGLDYLPADASSTAMVIGSAVNPFTGVLDGTEHTVSGIYNSSSEGNVGLFASFDGAEIKNLGITDSAFSLTGSGNAGSFAGTAANTSFSKCFSSARVEQGNSSPVNVYVGGFSGVAALSSFTSCYFTGSVGITAANNVSYPVPGGSGEYYSAGFTAKLTDETSFVSCYVASYIHGDITADVASALKSRNIGVFAAKGGADATLTGCSADFSSCAEGSYALGDSTSVTVGTVSATGGFYPSVWSAANRTTREKASRVTAVYSTSAASLSRAETASGVFVTDNYGAVNTVFGEAGSELYGISVDGKAINRTNSGIASVVLKYTGEDLQSSGRLLTFNLQCWYDNYSELNGVKTFTLKSVSDLIEFARIVHDAADTDVGHSHGSTSANSAVAAARFEGAVVKLGNNILVNDEVLSIIGDSPLTAFAGTFDGNGYSIINANLESSGGVCGLFGYIAGSALVKNVSLNGTTSVVIPASETAPVYAGLIISQLSSGSIENCNNYSNVSITNNGDVQVCFGAIAGKLSSGKTLSNCYNMGHITAITDSMRIAGIVGENCGTVTNCYNTGVIDGFSDLSDVEYVRRTVVSGIAALNSGTVTQCYNAGVLRFYADGALYPIAPGTVSLCYADGQYLTTSYIFTENAEYSAGVTLLSTGSMSDGAAFDNSWTGWTYRQGFYPELASITAYSGNGNGKMKAASLSSAYAGILADSEDGLPAFDNFTSVSFTPQSTGMTVSFAESNLGKFSNSVSGSSVVYTVTKRGAAILYLGCMSGDDAFSREVYYVNEEEFTVKYMFDFSELLGSSAESQVRAANEFAAAGVNTFADAATREDYGSGTAGNPYLINTAADLAAFSRYINQSTAGGRERYYKLISDIDCSTLQAWEPIGTVSHPFEGTFNGNGYSVTGISSGNLDYNGLFGYAGENSTIEIVAVESSVFTAKTGSGVTSYTGALAAYSEGVITNCRSRAIITVPNSTEGTIYAGGIVGVLSDTAVLRGSYVRPDAQNGSNVEPGHNTIVSYTSSNGLVCGILAGKTEGAIDGCYHTAVYYEPVGYSNLSDYGIIAGDFAGGTIQNTYYDCTVLSLQSKPLFLSHGNSNIPLLASAGNDYAKTTDELKATEHPATENGVANDSMAQLLSENIYLGTYEMAPLAFWDAQHTPYSNDGYPMLTSFDVLQYDFTHFESSNIILCIQNIDASNAKLMNALCTYDSYSFPVYAAIVAKTRLNINVFSLPDSISYNVSAVGYGYDDDDSAAIKWTVLNGIYTNRRGLQLPYTDGDGNVSQGAGSEMVNNTASFGGSFVNIGTVECIPDNCDKMYVYITLTGNASSVNKWGVYRSWDSSTLQELPPEEEETE